VFDLFQAATHFATQFNLSTSFGNCQSGIWNAIGHNKNLND